MKIAIIGFGREGKSVLSFLRRTPEFAGEDIWVLDQKRPEAIPEGVCLRSGKDYLKNLSDYDIIFRSPGIRIHLPEIQRAIKDGVRVTSLTKIFFEKCPAKIVGVTGTKGKGTTSTLIYEMLRAGGRKTYVAGNIGLPALDILPKLDKGSWAVLELSSFQLMDLEKSPDVAVALMVTSEHLDWHKDTKEYVEAKANLAKYQSAKDIAILAEDYPSTKSYTPLTKATVYTFSRHHSVRRGTYVKNGAFWFVDGKKREKIAPVEILNIPGEHNWENAAAAITAARAIGIPKDAIKRALARFKGLEHRLEFVREVKGVRYFNDSYSTTPETAEVAIQAFAAPKILILGGSPKGSDFRELGKLISKTKSVKAIVGVGVEWPRIKKHIKAKHVTFIEGAKNMAGIMRAVKRVAAKGDVVLLSPACASFGMFKNYSDRGAQFKNAVKALK